LKAIAIGLKVLGFILIFTTAFVPIYKIYYDATPLSEHDKYTQDSLLISIFGSRVEYNTIGYDYNNNITKVYTELQIPSNIVLLSAALWFLLFFSVLAAALGQVFQSGGVKKRGNMADIMAALFLLVSLIVLIIAINRTLNFTASEYKAVLSGQTATPSSAVTFNPNDSNPSYFLISLRGKMTFMFYIYIIGVLLTLTGLFLPVDWTKPSEGTFSRKFVSSKPISFIKQIATMRLTIYILRRLLTLIPLFIAIMVMTFVMVSGLGDPVALLLLGKINVTEEDKINLTRSLGLDQPVYARFVIWFYNFLHGNMGESYRGGRSINTMIGELVWETLKLQLASFVLALLIAIPLGVVAAKNQNTWIDSTASTIALLGLSMPIFVFGLMLIYIFSGYGLGWLPAAKAHSIPTPVVDWSALRAGDWGTWWSSLMTRTGDSIIHMILPTTALTFASLATYTRLVRTTMLEVLRQDYILAARANGLSERVITWKHAWRNVLIPVVTYVGLFLASALAGAPITETLFTWPGLGYRYVVAVGLLDFPMILGTTAILTILILLGNLVTDIVYVAVDPRIEL